MLSLSNDQVYMLIGFLEGDHKFSDLVSHGILNKMKDPDFDYSQLTNKELDSLIKVTNEMVESNEKIRSVATTILEVLRFLRKPEKDKISILIEEIELLRFELDALHEKERYDHLPKGSIIMWYGRLENVPPGWTFCDGKNGTPNLVDRFVMGGDNVGRTGGTADAVVVNHVHDAVEVKYYGYSEFETVEQKTCECCRSGTFAMTTRLPEKDSRRRPSMVTDDGKGKNLPPYMVLGFIMKTN